MVRDDFRLVRNDGLAEATYNHDEVVVFYLYKDQIFKEQQAQKWWLNKSILNFQKKLNELNINLEIVETKSFKIFFDKLIQKNDFSIYWNKVYEPEFLKFDEYLLSSFKNNNIVFKRFRGNALNEIHEVKKNDGTPFKVFTPFWRTAEKHYIDKIPSKKKIIKKCKKKVDYFENCFKPEKILPKKIGLKISKKFGCPTKKQLQRNCKILSKRD